MKDLIRNKVFIASFLTTYFGFFIATIWVLDFNQPYVGLSTAYGYPFIYYISHCYGGSYLYKGLIGNILFAAILGTILGILFSYLRKNVFLPTWTKVTSSEFRKKYHL